MHNTNAAAVAEHTAGYTPGAAVMEAITGELLDFMECEVNEGRRFDDWQEENDLTDEQIGAGQAWLRAAQAACCGMTTAEVLALQAGGVRELAKKARRALESLLLVEENAASIAEWHGEGAADHVICDALKALDALNDVLGNESQQMAGALARLG